MRAHLQAAQRGRAKTLCGLLINSPREALVNESGVHRYRKPRLVGAAAFRKMRWPEKCGRCERSLGELWFLHTPL